jgi:hypothetical protein
LSMVSPDPERQVTWSLEWGAFCLFVSVKLIQRVHLSHHNLPPDPHTRKSTMTGVGVVGQILLLLVLLDGCPDQLLLTMLKSTCSWYRASVLVAPNPARPNYVILSGGRRHQHLRRLEGQRTPPGGHFMNFPFRPKCFCSNFPSIMEKIYPINCMQKFINFMK